MAVNIVPMAFFVMAVITSFKRAVMIKRRVDRMIPSIETSDGAGVKLRRSIGSSHFLRLDPFLMLDEFYSDDPNDYLAGFPSHPHRGFETVTYMIDGFMRHVDSMGNSGVIGPGDVQWMSAGRGVIHSEMPEQTEGRMRGFQLWINLPAAAKMKPPTYQDIPKDSIPEFSEATGLRVRIIAGRFEYDGRVIPGPINALSADPYFLDVYLPAGHSVSVALPLTHNSCVYVYEGEAMIGDETTLLVHRATAILTEGDAVDIMASKNGARFLLLAGRPLNEPIVQHGPFVMSTREEIEEAISDYQCGRLTDSAKV